MLDFRYLKDNLDDVRKRTGWRNTEVDFDRIEALLAERLELIHKAETARHEQRVAQKKMRTLDKSGREFEELRLALRNFSAHVKGLDDERKVVSSELDDLLLTIPNLVHDSVPIGDSEDDNTVIRTVGEPREFDFEVKDHVDLGEGLGLIDLSRAAKVAGSRFAFLLGPIARMSRALISFMLDLHLGEHGYQELLPPFMVNADALTGTGQLPKFEEDLFKTDQYYLVPTAEVPVTNLYREEILDGDQLPIKYAAYTPCFRREAGSYGVDTRGLIRQHQFDKVELVNFVDPETSYDQLEVLVREAERVLQKLELPYRVVSLSTGDLGFSAAKCYDIEVWIPSQNRYREISSCSNFEAFQARRADIRFRREPNSKPEFVHTLNGSGLAIGRTIVAIMENYQNADGSIRVPEALVHRLGGLEVIEPHRP